MRRSNARSSRRPSRNAEHHAKELFGIDRDTKFDARFREILHASGLEVLLTAFQAPDINAFAERFVRSITVACLSSR